MFTSFDTDLVVGRPPVRRLIGALLYNVQCKIAFEHTILNKVLFQDSVQLSKAFRIG